MIEPTSLPIIIRMVKVMFGALGEGLSMSDMVVIEDGLYVDDGMWVLGWKDQNEEDALRRLFEDIDKALQQSPFVTKTVKSSIAGTC